jgi:hypothetical protein
MRHFGFGFGFVRGYDDDDGGDVSFEMVVNTTLPGSDPDQMDLPMAAGVEVDWGDGTVNNLNTHTYSSGGIYTIVIFEEVTGFKFNNGGDKSKLIDVIRCRSLNVDDTSMFQGCNNVTWTSREIPIISTTNLTSMFNGATVFNGNLDNWPTELVTIMAACFNNNKALDHVMDWPVAECLNFSFMYSEANDVIYAGMVYELKSSASIDCSNMFRANNAMADPMGFTNSASITDHAGMYSFTDVDDFPTAYDFSNTTDMGGMFQQAALEGTITALNVPLVTSLSDTFGNNNLTSVTGITTGTALLNTSFMFSANPNLVTVGLFDTQNVTNAASMFNNTDLTSLPAYDWSSCSNFTNFLNNVTINTTDYDAFLVEVDANGLSNVVINGGNSTYTAAPAAGGVARAAIISRSGTIIDGGEA